MILPHILRRPSKHVVRIIGIFSIHFASFLRYCDCDVQTLQKSKCYLKALNKTRRKDIRERKFMSDLMFCCSMQYHQYSIFQYSIYQYRGHKELQPPQQQLGGGLAPLGFYIN